MNADSVKARLKNYCATANISFQDALTYYGLERSIYRISISKYAGHFVLKGGIFLYALYDGNYARATTDIDLLARNISNHRAEMDGVFREIFSMEVDDGLTYDLGTLNVKTITEFKEYHGLNVSVFAHLDRTRIPVSIDIGYGDVVVPAPVSMKFPVLLETTVPELNVYSVESAVAEKFDAIVELGLANTRYKDFYDIYMLSHQYTFELETLVEAVRETMAHRKTVLEGPIVGFEDEFVSDFMHQSRWNAFLKRKKTVEAVGLEETVAWLKVFFEPVVKELSDSAGRQLTWKPKEGCWK